MHFQSLKRKEITLKEDQSPFIFFFSEQAEELEAILFFGDLDRRDSNCVNE